MGNPISKSLAKKAAVQYVNEKYSQLNLDIGEPSYNFKFSAYGVKVQSKTSKDTVFTIHVDGSGNVKDDDYQYEVANNFTTWRRLGEELDAKAKGIIGSKLDYDFDLASIRFVEESKGKQELLKLQRDMKLDIQNPSLPLEAYAVIFTDDVSYNKIAEVAKAIETTLKNQSVPISQYSVRLIPMSDKPGKEDMAVSWVNSLSVSSFPVDLMSEANLPKVMEQFEKDRIVGLDKK